MVVTFTFYFVYFWPYVSFACVEKQCAQIPTVQNDSGSLMLWGFFEA